MTGAEAAEFLADANKYTLAEAAAELDSLRIGEWDDLPVSDTGGTGYLITYDPETDGFAVAGDPAVSG